MALAQGTRPSFQPHAAMSLFRAPRAVAGSQSARAVCSGAPPRAPGPLPSPPQGVRMDVDVLNPMISAVKTNWQQLPEPVKQVAPFLGARGRGIAYGRAPCLGPRVQPRALGLAYACPHVHARTDACKHSAARALPTRTCPGTCVASPARPSTRTPP